MLRLNNWIAGLLAGSVLPAITWVLFEYPLKNFVIMNKPAVPYLVAIAANLLLIKYTFTNGAEHLSKGIMLTTFACTILIFIFKIR